jgi:hypothetical protein
MREVARRLSLPEPVFEAICTLRDGTLQSPPSSLRDTLLLANLLAFVPSPLGGMPKLAPDALAEALGDNDLADLRDAARELAESLGRAMLV